MLVGCLDYKAYDIPAEEKTVEDADNSDLLKEIEQIEKELEMEEAGKEASEETKDAGETTKDKKTEPKDKVKEVVLPELKEDKVEELSSEELDIISVKENELVKLKVDVSDPDKDPVTYSFTKPLNKDGEWKTNYGDAGEYIVTVTASDGKLTSDKKIKIVVVRVNVPPVIEGVGDITVNEGQLVSLEPKVKDPNNDAVTVTITEPLKTGTFKTDHTSAGEYKVKIVASDGELQTEKTIRLKVNDVNVLPEISNIPTEIRVKEGEKVIIKPEVTDLDGDDFKVTISDPVGNDGVWEVGFTEHGDYTVTVVVDDGKDKVTRKIKLKVEDVNMPPEIKDISVKAN